MSMSSAGTILPRHWLRHWLRLVGLGLVMTALIAGCGSDSASEGSGALQIHFDYVREEDGSENAGGRVVIDVIVLGADKSRTTTAWYFDGELDETFVTIRDGNRALMYNEDAEPAYTVLEAADEHPEEFFEELSLGPEIPQFQDACPGAKPSGQRTILGRDAVGYACEPLDPCSSTKSEIWLDTATGLLLEFGVKKATEVTVDPVIDETTFSTTPPPGAEVHVIEATGEGAPAPSGSENEQPELSAADALRKIAATSPTPIYYLGPEFEGKALCDIDVFAHGSEVGSEVTGDLNLDGDETVLIWYGRDFQMETAPFDPGRYSSATSGCKRLDPLRGVPTVAQSDAVWLFTVDQVIRLGGLAYTPDKIAPAGAALRVAGQQPTSEDLPAPLARNVTRVDVACGASPVGEGPVGEGPVGEGHTVPGWVVAVVLLAAAGAAVAARRRRIRAARPS